MQLFSKIGKATVQYFKNTNLLLLIFASIATCYGLALVYSAAHAAGTGVAGFRTQFIVFFVGTVLAIVISLVDYRTICTLWPVWAGITVFLVVLTFTPLGLNASGTDDTAWLKVPIIGTFQPSELLKTAFIITFSLHLSKVRDHINHPLMLLLLGVHALLPIGMIFLQGDDGTALVFIFITLIMLFAAGLHWGYLLGGLTALVAAIPIVWHLMDDSKKGRFLCLFFVEEYAQTSGWQQMQGITAIGSGQLTGVGYLNGNGFFARNNDFIFTVAGEEFGFLGSVFLLLVLALVIWALWRGARTAHDDVGAFLCTGIMAMIGAQSVINIGMNLRLLPVIGITLPFFSAGGSSLLSLYIAIGVALSVTYTSRLQSKHSIFIN